MVVPIPTDVIDDHVDDEREAIYLYLSENDDTSTHKKTDEERLGQMITDLRVAFDRDSRNPVCSRFKSRQLS